MIYLFYIIEQGEPARGTNSAWKAYKASENESTTVIDVIHGIQICEWAEISLQDIEEYKK